MKKIYILGGIVAVVLVFACQHDPEQPSLGDALREHLASISPTGSADFFALPASDDLAHIPQSPANPLTAEKVALGKLLFYEPAFGLEAMHAEGKQTYSCASCHIPAAGFRPNRNQGIADSAYGFGQNGEGRAKFPFYDDQELDAQGARPLSVLNVAFVTNSMWNGSFGSDEVNAGTDDLWGLYDPGTAINKEHLGSLEGQNTEGLKTHRMVFNRELVTQFGYKALFDAAFPDFQGEDRYTRKTAAFALTAYLRQLFSSEAPFQRWIKGEENALSEAEKRGALLFFGKAGCARCHNQPNLGSITFRGLGVHDLYENGGLKTNVDDRRNLGRGGFTGKDEDMFHFRVPQLYNLADSGPYFHGSSKKTLREVLDYFNAGLPENPRVPLAQISPYFTPLHLSAEELDDLEAFLAQGLRDPNLQRYVPETVLSGMCFPDNDPWSKVDMGCY